MPKRRRDGSVFARLPDAVKERILGFDCPATLCWRAHTGGVRGDRREYAARCGPPVASGNLRRACVAFRDPVKFKGLVDAQVTRLATKRIAATRVEVDVALVTIERILEDGDARHVFASPRVDLVQSGDGERQSHVQWIDNGGPDGTGDEHSTVSFEGVAGVAVGELHAFQDELQDLLASLADFWRGLHEAAA